MRESMPQERGLEKQNRPLPPSALEGSFVSVRQKINDSSRAIESHENAKSIALRDQIEAKIQSSLADRGQDSAIAERSFLQKASIKEREPVNETSNNTVEKVTIETDDGGKIMAFGKSVMNETFYEINPNGDVKVLKQSLDVKGNITSEKKSIIGPDKSQIEKFLSERRKDDAGRRISVAEFYGIAPDQIPIPEELAGLKYIDRGHATKSEYSASVFDSLLKFDAIQPTAMRQEAGGLTTYQLKAAGELLPSEALQDVLENKREAKGAKSIMRMACMDFLMRQTDRHINNIFWDEKTEKFSGIDNGCANQLSQSEQMKVQTPTGKKMDLAMPIDKHVSVPMDMIALDEEWKLDEDAHKNVVELFNNINDYLKYTADELTPEQIAALPEHVKQGRDAKAISDTYRLLHERTDEQGNIIPETSQIAKTEANEFLKRLYCLAVYKRPPNLDEDFISKNYLPAVKIILERHGR
ncbi:hypothetical protein GF391_01290 [Candidatus Uhrbacteria bacterium]|nr:hypothetical protein [Candidatus Uhrbacteria bacterium]